MADKPKQTRRRYTDEEKAAALALVDFNANLDSPVAVTAKALQLPDSTIDNWKAGRYVNEQVEELRGEKKKTLDALCEEYAREALSKLIPNLDNITPRDFTSIGIAIDKMLLLRGQPTAITESRNAAELRREAEAALALLLPDYGNDKAAALAAMREIAPTLSEYVN